MSATASINLSPVEPVLDARHLDRLIGLWLDHCAATLDAATAEGYGHKIAYFRQWWAAQGPAQDWCLGQDDLARFGRYLEIDARTKAGRALSYNTRHDALRRLRQALRWAHSRGYVSLDFAQYVPDAKGGPPPKVPVGLDTLALLLDACAETNEPVRNRAVIAMLAGTGIRCEECAALRVEQVKIYADGSGYVRLTVAKNDKLRVVTFDAVTGSYLCAWLVQLPYSAGPIFPSRKRRKGQTVPLTPGGLYKVVVRVTEIAEARDEVRGAHDFRRLFATTWHKVQPGTTSLLQRQLGHRSIETTMLYVLDSDDMTAEMIRSQPVTPMAQLHLMRGQ